MEIKNRKKHRFNNRDISIKAEDSKKEGQIINRCIVFTCCIVIAVLNYWHVSHMQENHIMFSHLSTIEREMSFRTEMGFYYSFYKQVVEAPSLLFSLSLLTRDNITEYPETINALQRFNVYPELIVGAFYRIFSWFCELYGLETRTCYTVNRQKLSPVQSCEGLGEPAIFYVTAVMVLNGAMLPFLFLIGRHFANRSILGGFVATLFYFFNHRECTRVQWTPPLRESFSYPFLMMQQYFLLQLFSLPHPSKRYEISKYGFLLTTLAALLSWQFAQFCLLTQSIAVFMAYVVAGDANSKAGTQRILLLLLVADILNVVLQFGNTLLLVGPLRPCIIMSLVIILMEPSISLHLRNSAWAPVRWTVLTGTLLISTVVLKYAVSVALQIKSDDHMLDILRSKFSDFRSFDSLLYTCAPEFDFYDVSSLLELSYTGLFPISILFFIAIILHSIVKWYRLCRTSSNELQNENGNFLTNSGFCQIETYYVLFQTVAYTTMAALIMRLKLFWTPQLCILAALMFHPRWSMAALIDPFVKKMPLLGRLTSGLRLHTQWPGVLVVALCAVNGLGNLRTEWAISGAYSNWDQEQLLGAIMDRTGPQDSFVGQMATMATVRLVTGRAITMHPHYEDEQLRQRVHTSYAVFSRRSVHDVWLSFRSQLQATHFVFEPGFCSQRRDKPGCSYMEMWDLEEPQNAARASLCQSFIDHISEVFAGHKTTDRGVGRYFRWRFTTDNGVYSLFEVASQPSP